MIKKTPTSNLPDQFQPPGRARHGKALTTEIGRQLRQYFDQQVDEKLPDRFQDLLARLDEADRKAKP